MSELSNLFSRKRYNENLREVHMKENIEYVFKGFFRAFGESFCFYVVLPLWALIIKISERKQ